MTRRPIEQKARSVYRAARYSSIGLELGVSVVIGMLMGLWADGKLDSSPWGVIAGIALGFVAAIRSIRRTLQALLKEDQEQAEAPNDDG